MATVTGSQRQLAHTSDTYTSNGNITVGGNLEVQGTTTTIDTANLLVEDKNIVIGNVTTPSDTTADGGGITLKGATDKTLNWVDSTDSWTSSETFSAPNLSLTSLSSGASVTTALMLSGTTVVTRGLGSAAFSNTSAFAAAGDENIIDGATSIWNADGDGDVFIYNDANPTHNTKYVGAMIDITGDGTYQSSLVRAGIFTSDHVSTENGYYVGTLLGSGNSTTTQVINSSGVWTGAVIPSAKLDADTAHLSGTQTFSGAKTFSTNPKIASTGNISFAMDKTNVTTTTDLVSYVSFQASGSEKGWVGFGSNGNSDLTVRNTSGKVVLNGSSGSELGTVVSGTWQATDIGVAYGGTGASNAADARSNLGITPANIGAATSSHTHGRLYAESGTTTNYLSLSSSNELELFNNSGTIIDLYLNYNGGANSIKGPSGNVIWHAGNDGSGSGLDADTLDGQHASAFATSGHTHSNATSSASGFMSNTDKSKLDGIAAGANNYSHPTHPGDDISIDTGALTGATVISDLDFNVTTDTLGHVTDANAAISTRNLTYSDVGAAASSHTHDDRYFTETESDARFLGISAKAADSNLLDGIDSSAFLRSNANDTTTGSLTISGSSSYGTYSSASQYHTGADNLILKGNSSGISTIFFESEKDGTNINHPTDFGFIQYHPYGTGTTGESNELIIGVSNDSDDNVVLNAPNAYGLKFRIGTSETDYNIWHSGNDGTGSGLDADLLDGQHGSYYATATHTHDDRYYTETEATNHFKTLAFQGNYMNNYEWSTDLSGSTDSGWGGLGTVPYYPSGSFANNGTTAENTRSISELPNGAYGVVWRTPLSDTASDGDGGWNCNINGVQDSKLYRSVVYFRRTADVDAGTFYHGCSSSSTANISDATNNTNPYFHNTSIDDKFVVDRWYVSVGYIQPYQSGGGTNSGVTGIYDCVTGKKIIGGSDFMMKSGSVSQQQRTYIYYSSNTATEGEWWGPRFEEVNGNEPSIRELIAKGADGVLGMTIHSEFDPATLDQLTESSDAADDKFLLWDQSAGVWKYIRMDDLQDSIDTNTTYTLGSFGITATSTELNYTDGVTSNIQTQLNARLADSANGTIGGSRNFTGTFSLGGTTITATGAELNYVDGVTSNIQTQLNAKAPLASPALTGVPTAPTAAANTNTTQIATTAYVQTEIADLIGGAPGALDTLNEIAAAINDDSDYAGTITSALSLKAPLASPAFSGNPTAPTPATSDNDTSIATTAFVKNQSYLTTSSAASTYLGISAKAADSDLLDGLNSSQFLRGDANDTLGGVLTILTGSDPKLILQSSSGDSSDWNYINFNGRDGVRDGYVGTDADGDFIIHSQKNGTTLSFDSSGINSSTTLNVTGNVNARDILLASGYTLQRSSHNSGHLEGSYNNVGANAGKSNPIYTIGSGYNPGDATLSNMYGVGYTHTDASFITFTGASGWGQYIAADGDARVWLGGSNGVISSTGEHYVGSNKVFHDGYHPNADTLTTARTITLGGDLSGSASFNGSVDITISAAVANDSHTHNAGNLTGSTLASGVTGSSLTSVGTISSGTWNGSVIASAYLDSDTAHLSGAQTFTGAKTFNSSITIDDAANTYAATTSEILFTNASDVPALIGFTGGSPNKFSVQTSGGQLLLVGDSIALNGGNVSLDTIAAATTDTDKFLVSDGGTVKYRTGAQVRSDIGAQAAGTYNTIIGTDTDINTSGSTIIDNIYVTDGVITSMGTRTLTPGDIGAATSAQGTTADNALPKAGGTMSGNINMGGSAVYNNGYVAVNTSDTRSKYRLWGTDGTYAIGMGNSYSFGGLNSYAMSFQFSNNSDRGFWWGDSGHTDAQGAMSLTTDGKLTTASSIRVGFGESDTTAPNTYYSEFARPIKLDEWVYTSRPSAYPRGQKAFLIDSPYPLSTCIGNVISGGGSYFIPVYSDGTYWRAG